MARLALPGFLYMIAQGIYSSMSLSQRNNWNAHKHMDVFVTLTVFGIIRGIGLVALVSLNNPVPLRQSMMSRKSMMSKLTETASEMTSTGEKMEDLELPGITRPNKSWGQLFSRGVSTLA
ncbi:hypothetical protein BDF22DRAFT_692135 [Syncephalis plumigaleata]|nr:hypothetical protein BDF22DRAFT_692135 [Syncephalis plumigaleata]